MQSNKKSLPNQRHPNTSFFSPKPRKLKKPKKFTFDKEAISRGECYIKSGSKIPENYLAPQASIYDRSVHDKKRDEVTWWADMDMNAYLHAHRYALCHLKKRYSNGATISLTLPTEEKVTHQENSKMTKVFLPPINLKRGHS